MMRRATLVWATILALCVAATLHEIPNIVTSARQHADLFIDPEDHPGFMIPDRIVAEDPEARDILRYGVKWRYAEPVRADLRKLLAKYPDNAFLRAAWAEAVARRDGSTVTDVLPIIERLQREDPDNAYYQYLKGWALLRTRGGERRLPEALQAFAVGHDLPRFHDPYRQYKERVDALAEKATLRSYHRPRITPFYAGLSDVIRNAARWESADPESLDDLITSIMRVADRAIENAYDAPSVDTSASQMRRIEEFRLSELDLSQAEAWQARLRLSQAIATDDLHRRWDVDGWLAGPSWWMYMMPWVMLLGILVKPLGPRWRRSWVKSTGGHKWESAGALPAGVLTLVAIVVFLLTYKVRPLPGWMRPFLDLPWFMIALLWIDYARGLAMVGPAGPALIDSRSKWAAIVFGLFAVNGVLLLLVGNTAFMWSRSFAGWFEHTGIFAVWLAFCALLWVASLDRRAVLGRISHAFAVTFVVCWVGFLLAFDLAGGRWHHESRACAEPLSVYGPLPTASQETYERVIRDAGPPRYVKNKANALPRYARYFAPEDMEAFLEKRRTEGKPLTRTQIEELLENSPRDVRPVLRKALAGKGITEKTEEKGT